MATTQITTWAQIFGHTFREGYNADPNHDIEMTEETRTQFLWDCMMHIMEAVDAALEPYGAHILGNGDIIGPVGTELPEAGDLREMLGSFDCDDIIDQYI